MQWSRSCVRPALLLRAMLNAHLPLLLSQLTSKERVLLQLRLNTEEHTAFWCPRSYLDVVTHVKVDVGMVRQVEFRAFSHVYGPLVATQLQMYVSELAATFPLFDAHHVKSTSHTTHSEVGLQTMNRKRSYV